MKLLETRFKGAGEMTGVIFKQLQKSEKAFMYELTDVETRQKRWEVFEKRVSKANEATFGGKLIKYEEQELYPKSNCFGAWAWCFTDFEKAIVKFQTLENLRDPL